MKKQDLKTLVILILLAANILLEAQIIPRKIAEKRDNESLKESIVSICRQNHVELDISALPQYVPICRLDTGRDYELEKKTARTLLGEVTQQDMGGGIISYDTEDGSAVFRAGGEFQIRIGESRQITDTALEIFDQVGFLYDETDVAITENNGITTVTAVQQIQGVPVCGCSVSAEYEYGRLTGLHGRWITQYSETKEEGSDLATSIVGLLHLKNQEGMVFSRIDSVSQCMVLSHEGGGISLHPAWLMQTDTGAYSLDGLTDEMIE